ncbi:enhancer of split m3 protein-like [Macrosteles quadrilineatus]|uniref:enhancer of split m3 protein-like n=1 Tax=Macrosteles quadrilineatus TaxID=74068 RepID=UPI0023E22703|nr:enhancer of split m3 protein-like [Macrosteles quadrilineatus]
MEVTSTSRKIRKPLMEKKRRARINDSLNELRRLLAESSTQESEKAKAAKLEKADILELAVKHVQYLHDRLGLSGQKENKRDGTEERDSHENETKRTVLRESVRLTRLPSGEVALIISTRPSPHLQTQPSQPRLMWRPW